MKILVTGADGLVGSAVTRHCIAEGDDVVAHNHQSLDIADMDAVREALARDLPDVLINCAAWTDVDGCQSDPERAYQVNAHAVENLAIACRERAAGYLTISTDFVFDGTKDGFYTQRDDPVPQSVYGESKLQGERMAQSASARTIVVRTGWIFGRGGRNFLSTVIERAQRGEQIAAIADGYGTPTFANHLAVRLRELAQLDIPGIYHVVNDGPGTSYEEFTRAALELVECSAAKVESISMDSLRRPAPRPRNSRLRCLVSQQMGLLALPGWEDALRVFAASTIGTHSDSGG